jgi:hypothetical protein
MIAPRPSPIKPPHWKPRQSGGLGEGGSKQWPATHIFTIVQDRQTPAKDQPHPTSMVVRIGNSGLGDGAITTSLMQTCATFSWVLAEAVVPDWSVTVTLNE